MSTTCKKESDDEVHGEGLVGKWVLKQTLISPGPVGEWEHYWGPRVSLTFRDDGTMESSRQDDLNDPFDRYQVNGNYITFYQNSSTDSLRKGYNLNGNELVLWGPCFEPCGSKYKRVQ
jgi:hypothetical protein